MKLKKKINILASGLVCGVLLSTGLAFADNSSPVELSANTIEYNSTTELAKAEGDVRITQDSGVLTGARAEYNMNTKRIVISGGVNAVKGDMHVTAGEVIAVNNELTAEGNVLLTKGANRLSGPVVIYNQVNKNISMPQGGDAVGETAEIRGNSIQGNLESNQYSATGNVFLYSKTNDFKTTCQRATYVGNNKDFRFDATGNVEISSPSRNLTSHSSEAQYNSQNNGQLILQGGAVVKQNNNTIKGNVLTVYLGKDIKIQ